MLFLCECGFSSVLSKSIYKEFGIQYIRFSLNTCKRRTESKFVEESNDKVGDDVASRAKSNALPNDVTGHNSLRAFLRAVCLRAIPRDDRRAFMACNQPRITFIFVFFFALFFSHFLFYLSPFRTFNVPDETRFIAKRNIWPVVLHATIDTSFMFLVVSHFMVHKSESTEVF